MAMGKLGWGIRALILLSLLTASLQAQAGPTWRSCAWVAALLVGTGVGGTYFLLPGSNAPVKLELPPERLERTSEVDTPERLAARLEALDDVLDQQALLPLALKDEKGKVPQPAFLAKDLRHLSVAFAFKQGLVQKSPELKDAAWLKAAGLAVPIESIVLEPIAGDAEHVLLNVVFPLGSLQTEKPVSKEALLSGNSVEIRLGPLEIVEEEGKGIVEALVRVRYQPSAKRLVITEGTASLRMISEPYKIDLSDTVPLDRISSEPLPLP